MVHSRQLSLIIAGFALAFFSISGVFAQGQSLAAINFPQSNTYPGSVASTGRPTNPGIASGSSSGYYIRFGEDLANLCANYGITPSSGDPNYRRFPRFRVNVFATGGGFDNIKRLRGENQVQLAIVQSDLWYYANQYRNPENAPGVNPKIHDAWGYLADHIQLVLPLYTEKIHLVVRPDTSTKFTDLVGLFQNQARIAVGGASSGSMITATMLEESIMSNWKKEWGQKKRWIPVQLGADAALRRLVNAKGSDQLDAVLLVGGVPYPGLEKYGLEKLRRGLFGTQNKPDLTLLPFGRADEVFDNMDAFKGYLSTEITSEDYKFLGENFPTVKTRGVTACLVTHKAYTTDSRESHKILWVRHIVYRLLTKMDPSTNTGLPFEFVPRAGDMWKQVKPVKDWDAYGWKRHEDVWLRKMVDAWGQDYGQGTSSSPVRIINPNDDLID